MKLKSFPPSGLPKIVTPAQWQKSHDKLLAKEKLATRARDALAAERRRGPMYKIETPYTFTGPKGKISFLDLFEGRPQLLLYHFMFAPEVGGWPTAGCPGCSLMIDQISNPAHIHARNTSFAIVSLAPFKNIQRYKKRMGWPFPWFSSAGTTFNADFHMSPPKGEDHGLSVFIHDGKSIYRTHFTQRRGLETIGSPWSLLDLTPLGRQEKWEKTPKGRPQTDPYQWWRRHDEYK